MPCWPNGKRLLIVLSVMLESYSEGRGPSYSVQTTALKPGLPDRAAESWGRYGGAVGVWRLVRTLGRHGVPATFFTSGRSTEAFPEAVMHVVRSGHDVAGHGYVQDQVLAELTPAEERRTIGNSLDALERLTGKRPEGWLSPVLATTPQTLEVLAAERLLWHADVNDLDHPQVIQAGGRRIVAIPHSDFMDNRTLRTNPRHYFDVYKSTFDFLYATEPGALLPIGVHCQYGGRPLMCAVFDEVLRYVTSFPDAGVATHGEIARWFLDGAMPSSSYAERYPDRS